MRIIDRIEISYFRSVFKATITDLNSLNILVGRNDAGKSNILKALNLFFNNESELNTPFHFADDLSRIREEEVRRAKGRATIWIKITFNNFRNWKSLPEQFTVKKTWNRYSEQPDIKVQSEGDIAETTLGKFLNQFSFHYIPAIRDRRIFSHYLSLLHDSLLDDERIGVSESSGQLMNDINEGITELSDKVRATLGFDSRIQPPTDLRQLFSALDFSTEFSGYRVPLQKRGDGIQARHIPFILDFIAQHTNKTHIWAYEEPENSLEMGRAFNLAEQFRDEFSRENQIFVSTHSPAFYGLQGENVSRWKVLSDETETDGRTQHLTITSPVSDLHSADAEVGLAALISSRTKEIHERLESIEKVNEDLRGRVREYDRPVLVVEGETDVAIISQAYRILYNDEPYFQVLPGGNAESVARFCTGVSKISGAPFSQIIGLVDNDHEGHKMLQRYHILNRERTAGGMLRVVDSNASIFCGQLPMPDPVDIVLEHLDEEDEDFLNVPVEYLMREEFVNRALNEGHLELEPTLGNFTTHGGSKQLELTDVIGRNVPDYYKYLLKKPSSASKRRFQQYIEQEAIEEDFVYFRPIFEALNDVLD